MLSMFLATRRQEKLIDKSYQGATARVTTVSIDDWIFNFGPNQFQYQLILENGRVGADRKPGVRY